MNSPSLIWIDGKTVAVDEAKISALSQTFHYGFGVYEGIRSYQTKQGASIFRLSDHTDRLFYSASLLNIAVPYEKEMLNKAHHELLQKNNLSDAYLRPVVFMGDEFLGLHTQKTSVHVMIAAIPWNNFYIAKEQKKRGISIKTASYERVALKNKLHKAKANGLYLIAMMANNEAQAAGFQEALLLDPNGFVAEGSGANIFMVKDSVLYTPHLEYVLDGITRKTIIELASHQQITVIEKNISLDELYLADEVFFSGTAAEVLPITRIDSHQIGSGEMGPMTEAFQTLYSSIVQGEEDNYSHWLNFNNER